MSNTTEPGAGPRERLLQATQELTYVHGVGLGVDAILQEAKVARRSLYQHFGGKDGLIAEVLRISAAQSERHFETVLRAAGDDPRKRLLAVFDTIEQIISTPDFHGCRYISADLALTDPDHPAHVETRAHKQRVHQLLHDELVKLHHPDPVFAADQLQLLIDGAMVVGATRPEQQPAKAARSMAEHILDQAGDR